MEELFQAPVDYDEMAHQDYDFVRMIVARNGAVAVDDHTQEILTRFMEKDYLAMYNPDHTAEWEGTTYRIRWRRFVESNVAMRAQGLRDKERRQWRRERIVVDQPVQEDRDVPRTWFEAMGHDVVDYDYSVFAECEELIEEIRDRLSEAPVRGKRDIGRLFELIRTQILDEGLTKPNRKELAREMDVSVSAIGAMLKELRVWVSQCLIDA